MKASIPIRPLRSFMLLCIIIIFIPTILSSQYFWVGNGGNWSDYANHWATSSGGSTFHSQAPTNDDDVIFDENSFSNTGQIVTIDIDNSNCRNMNWENVTNNPSLESDVIINVFGSFVLSPNMTCNLRIVELEATTTGNLINTFGTPLGSSSIVRFYDKGTWELKSVIELFMIQHLEGTLNTNNNTITASSFIIDHDTEKTLNLGSSTINASTWRMTASNVTLNAGTSTIITNGFYADSDNSGPYLYHNVKLVIGGLMRNDAVIKQLTLEPNGNFDNFRIESGSIIEIEELVASGSKDVPVTIYAETSGEEAFIKKTSGTIESQYLVLTDIHGIGGATFNANLSVDNGNNAGWNFTPIPVSYYYWIGNGGSWSDLSHWAKTSGGNELHISLPTQFDRVVFDANSFSIDDQKVVLDTAVYVGSLVNVGVNNKPTIDAPYEAPLNILNELDFGEGFEGFIYNTSFIGSGAASFSQGPDIRMQNISFWGKGELNLSGPLHNGNLSIFDGSFNTNDHQMDLGQFKQGNFNKPTINFGASVINVGSNFSFQDPDTKFEAGSSIITVNKNFIGLDNTFNTVILTGTGNLEGENVFENLEFSPGSTISIEAGVTQTINNQLLVNGSSIQPINLSSTIEGEQASISVPNGTVNGTFLVLKDINAIGGATFNATESVDNGNNSGWNITFPIPKNYYWVQGEGEWEDYENHWAKSSGGSDFHIGPPTILDNLFFDENSFSEDGQKVTIKVDEVSFKNMIWDNLSHKPHFIANNVQLNIYGTIYFSANMEMSIGKLNFLSDGTESISFKDPTFPGSNTTMLFNGSGTWNILDSLSTRNFILESGSINTNDNGLHVDFATYFSGESEKVFNLGKTILNTRTLEWNTFMGANLTFNGGESTIICSSSFAPESQVTNSQNTITLNDLTFTNAGSDQANINSSIKVNTLTLDPGKMVKVFSGAEVEFEELVALGTSEDFIHIFGSHEDNQATFIKKSGTVNAEFLKLRDIQATGGATFNAYSSINEGNVSGWTFFKIDQTIDFPEIESTTVNTNSITLNAQASSNLEVSYSIISGPATVDEKILSLTGEPGRIFVKADQAGNINYNPAPAVIRDFCANPEIASISKEGNDLVSSSSEGNQWYLNGVLIENATDNTFTPEQDGEYAIIVTINDCSSEISTAYNFISSNTIDVSLSEEIIISPNPVSDYLTIHNSQPDRIKQFRIIDANGNLVRKLDGLSYEKISVSELRAGIYFLEIRSERSIAVEKFIVL